MLYGVFSQIVALTPVAETAQQFTEEYKTFASAIDTTRHELPIKNLHVEENREEFLGKWKDFSKESKPVFIGNFHWKDLDYAHSAQNIHIYVYVNEECILKMYLKMYFQF